jgi:hypothetical protein
VDEYHVGITAPSNVERLSGADRQKMAMAKANVAKVILCDMRGMALLSHSPLKGPFNCGASV